MLPHTQTPTHTHTRTLVLRVSNECGCGRGRAASYFVALLCHTTLIVDEACYVHFICNAPAPAPDTPHTPIDAARLLTGVQYTRMWVCVCVGGARGRVVAALPQRYFQNCILRFFGRFACFDRVAADFDLMTFQHSQTHTQTHTQTHAHDTCTQCETLSTPTSVESQSNNKHHSLTHSFAQRVSESHSRQVRPPPTNQSLTLAFASIRPCSLPSLMSGILRRG